MIPRPTSSRQLRSGPARDLWIEIHSSMMNGCPQLSGPARDLWIEILVASDGLKLFPSGPARDLWIEIKETVNNQIAELVGSRKGPVD